MATNDGVSIAAKAGTGNNASCGISMISAPAFGAIAAKGAIVDGDNLAVGGNPDVARANISTNNGQVAGITTNGTSASTIGMKRLGRVNKTVGGISGHVGEINTKTTTLTTLRPLSFSPSSG